MGFSQCLSIRCYLKAKVTLLRAILCISRGGLGALRLGLPQQSIIVIWWRAEWA